MVTDDRVSLVAKALADSIGHGMREKCLEHAKAVLAALAQAEETPAPESHVDARTFRIAEAVEPEQKLVAVPVGMELFGHWSKHRLADGCFLPLPCYVPEGPDYTTIALYRAHPVRSAQEAVKVRELDWAEDCGDWFADRYCIRQAHGYFIVSGWQSGTNPYDSLEAAQAAAQADYEQRIRSALATTEGSDNG